MRTRKYTLLMLALFLAACGTNDDDLKFFNIAQGLGQQILKTDKSAVAASQQSAARITRAQVDATPFPVIRVRLEGTGAQSTLIEVDRDGPNSTYRTGDGVALTFRNGMLTSTRGLGQDLMGLSAPNLSQAMRKGTSQRVYRYLDGEDHLQDVTLTCRLTRQNHGGITLLGHSYRVDQITEWCRNSDETISFENFYWIEPKTGRLRQSRQYISPKFGRAEIEVLKVTK